MFHCVSAGNGCVRQLIVLSVSKMHKVARERCQSGGVRDVAGEGCQSEGYMRWLRWNVR